MPHLPRHLFMPSSGRGHTSLLPIHSSCTERRIRAAIRSSRRLSDSTRQEEGPSDLSWSGLPARLARKITSSTFPRQPPIAGVLTTDQYRRLLAFIDQERANARTYNLLFYNCNDFVADAAEAIGLKAPLLRAIPPVLFILLLKEMNN